jgi:alkylhydroperoxidase family enzyme
VSDASPAPRVPASPAPRVPASPAPRVPPLPEAEQDEQARELLSGINVGGAPAANIFTTLVRHPGLFRRWLPFGGKLLSGKLPPRDRELLILRTGWLCHAEYEWAQHREIARSIGIPDQEIERVRDGAGAGAEGWDTFDATLIRAADELHADARISDDTWAALSERYDEHQLIEVPMLVGHYHMVAFTLNTLGVPLEPGLAGFDG